MDLKFYTPKNKLLQQLIEGYYFIVDNQKGGTEKYWTFPNNFCIVSINLNSRVLLSENSIKFFPSKKENIYTSVVHRYIHPIEIYYKKPIHELTIYFKPLGLNYFVRNIETLFLEKRMAGCLLLQAPPPAPQSFFNRFSRFLGFSFSLMAASIAS